MTPRRATSWVRVASALTVLAAIGCRNPGGERSDDGAKLLSLLPDEPVVVGWSVQWPESPPVASVESLLLPKGAIGRLRAAHVARLRQHSPSGAFGLTVQAWRMPSPLEACGAAADARRPGADYRPVGWECFVAEEAFAVAWGPYYVEGRLDGPMPLGRSVLESGLRQVRRRLQNVPPSPPRLFDRLPDRGLLLHSTRYDPARTFFGVTLEKVASASYSMEGLRGELFVAAYDNPALARLDYQGMLTGARWDRPVGGTVEQGVFGRDELLGPVSASRIGRCIVVIAGLGDRRDHAVLAAEAAVAIDRYERTTE